MFQARKILKKAHAQEKVNTIIVDRQLVGFTKRINHGSQKIYVVRAPVVIISHDKIRDLILYFQFVIS